MERHAPPVRPPPDSHSPLRFLLICLRPFVSSRRSRTRVSVSLQDSSAFSSLYLFRFITQSKKIQVKRPVHCCHNSPLANDAENAAGCNEQPSGGQVSLLLTIVKGTRHREAGHRAALLSYGVGVRIGT